MNKKRCDGYTVIDMEMMEISFFKNRKQLMEFLKSLFANVGYSTSEVQGMIDEHFVIVKGKLKQINIDVDVAEDLIFSIGEK